jgi:hypothetical protein
MPSTQPELASQHAGVPAQQHQQQQQQPLQFVAGHPISPATLATMAAAHQIQMQQLKAATSMQADAGAPAAADASMMVDDTTISAAASKLHVKAESPATVATAAAGGLEVPLLSPTHHVRLESTTSMAMDTTTTATATAATPVFSPTRAMPVVAAAIPIMMASGSTAHHATVAAGGHRAILLHQQQQHSYQQHDSEDDSDEDDDHPHLAQQYRPTSAAAAGVRSKKSKSARVSCHQCKTTKEDGLLLFCTTKAEKGLRKRKCRKKYVSSGTQQQQECSADCVSLSFR